MEKALVQSGQMQSSKCVVPHYQSLYWGTVPKGQGQRCMKVQHSRSAGMSTSTSDVVEERLELPAALSKRARTEGFATASQGNQRRGMAWEDESFCN